VSAELPRPLTDKVSFSLTAPATLVPGSAYSLNVWMHLEQQRQEVLERARQALGGEAFRVQSKAGVLVARGTLITARLDLPGFVVDKAEDPILWDGDIGNATFAVAVPAEARLGRHAGKVTFHAHGLPIARLHFDLEVGRQPAEVGPLPSRAERYRTAFASYASPDRDEVLARVQGMQAALPQLDVFLDVASLRAGDRWADRLAAEITRREVFYLFWSLHARASEWVEREWRTALRVRGINAIHPVPLAHPEHAPPPPELAEHLHFNDWVLAYLRGRR
jgi:hypothetical protein